MVIGPTADCVLRQRGMKNQADGNQQRDLELQNNNTTHHRLCYTPVMAVSSRVMMMMAIVLLHTN